MLIKTKNHRYRNTKTQKDEKKKQRIRKPSFTKKIGRKYRLIETHTERNNDHTRIMHKLKFCNSFKHLKNCNVLLFPIDSPVQYRSEKANLKQNFVYGI